MNGAMFVWEVVAMSVVVIAFFELMGGVFEVMISSGEIQWWIRVWPELCSLPCPPHGLQHLVPINIPSNSHPFHL